MKHLTLSLTPNDEKLNFRRAGMQCQPLDPIQTWYYFDYGNAEVKLPRQDIK
jgi:hypothetical protein